MPDFGPQGRPGSANVAPVRTSEAPPVPARPDVPAQGVSASLGCMPSGTGNNDKNKAR